MTYYAALASLMDLLHDILHRNRYPDFSLSRSQTIQSLHNQFSRLMDSLQDYSSKGEVKSDSVERDIRDAAHKAQDIIESEIPKQQKDSKSGPRNKLFQKIVRLRQNLLRPQLKLADCEEELLKVGQKVESILKEVNEIKESESQKRETRQLDYAADSDASEQAPPKMVGCEERLEIIKEQLCGHSPELKVISLSGMPGIGKTTLARTTFQDACIVEKFDFRIWVTISQDYDVIRVLQNIVKSLGIVITDELIGKEIEAPDDPEKEEELESDGEDKSFKEDEGKLQLRKELEAIKKKYREQERRKKKMQEKLEKLRKKKEIALKLHIFQYLKRRKYLVIIDDVWGNEVWNDLKSILPDDCNRSRVVLTTRLKNVAMYAGTAGFLHEIQTLSKGESWILLKKTAFEMGDCPRELEVIGKFIAGKCQGLPLAIVLIAGILSKDKALSYWTLVAKDVLSFLDKAGDNLSNILSLSYNHLPHQLKTCFLHMGSFPEDYEISISKLIRLWIAEGFLNSVNGTKSLEDIGEEYLEDLVKRSLVIITKKKANGLSKSCVIHDLLRDFCRKKGLCEYFFREGHSDPIGAEKARRIILGSAPSHMPWTYGNGKNVRSLCWFSKMADSNVHSLEWGALEQLRILDATDIETFVAPFAVSRMFHLKYLALRISSKKMKLLPQSISKFQDLQTLIIYAPRCVAISLPSEIWKMPLLRHLIIDRMILPPIAMSADSPLQKLEYLQMVETVEDFIFTDVVTEMIPNIKKLKLTCWGEEASGTWKKYSLGNLANLLQLEKLNIVFHTDQFSYVHSFRNSFSFPKNLRKLSLESCGLPWEELTVVGSLKYLEVLRLKRNALVGGKWEPVEHEFPKLKFLLMESLDLKQWTAEKECFQCLVHLKINNCSELEGIPSEVGNIYGLEFITVYDSKHAGESAKQILEEQRDYGNDVLQVLVRDFGIVESAEHFEDQQTTLE